jgi:hypothetical protein
MSDDYSIYGSGLKESSGPVNSSYSSNVGQVVHNSEEIERRKKAAAEDVNPVRVGETAHQVTESMGKVEPPIGEAITGAGKNLSENLSPYLLAPPVLYGLYKAWEHFSGGKPPDNNTPPPPPPPPAAPQAQPAVPTQTPQPTSVQGPGNYSLNPQSGYGQQNVNAPTGAPNPVGPVAPPEQAATASVEPKPVIPTKEERDYQSWLADEKRKDEMHQAKLAKQTPSTETVNKQKPIEPKSAIPKQDQAILANRNEVEQRAALNEKGLPKSQTASPVGGTETFIPNSAKPPEGTPPVKEKPPVISGSELESKLGAPTLKTGSGMPAYQGEGGEKSKMRKDFSSIKDVPSDYVFVPNGQNMDIVRNAVGQKQYTENLKEFGGYPSTPNQAYQQSRDINKSIGRLSREEAKSKGLSLGETTEGITKAVGSTKSVKVAGVTGALILASDLANAAEEGVAAAKQGDTQMARGYATDILGALTGPLGMLASQTLGTSPEDLKILRAAEQARKVGAGRGIAPPSAYKR